MQKCESLRKLDKNWMAISSCVKFDNWDIHEQLDAISTMANYASQTFRGFCWLITDAQSWWSWNQGNDAWIFGKLMARLEDEWIFKHPQLADWVNLIVGHWIQLTPQKWLIQDRAWRQVFSKQVLSLRQALMQTSLHQSLYKVCGSSCCLDAQKQTGLLPQRKSIKLHCWTKSLSFAVQWTYTFAIWSITAAVVCCSFFECGSACCWRISDLTSSVWDSDYRRLWLPWYRSTAAQFWSTELWLCAEQVILPDLENGQLRSFMSFDIFCLAAIWVTPWHFVSLEIWLQFCNCARGQSCDTLEQRALCRLLNCVSRSFDELSRAGQFCPDVNHWQEATLFHDSNQSWGQQDPLRSTLVHQVSMSIAWSSGLTGQHFWHWWALYNSCTHEFRPDHCSQWRCIWSINSCRHMCASVQQHDISYVILLSPLVSKWK